MKRVDFYFHDGCLSEPSILQLAKDVEAAYPRWTVAVHSLLDDDVTSPGFQVLPTVAIDGVPIGPGLPSKEWLLETLRVNDL